MFKINTKRTYQYPVSVTILDGDQELDGEFTATFKVLPNDALKDPENQKKDLLDFVLVDVSDVEVAGDDGQLLTGEALLQALKNDPCTAQALTHAYRESVAKKNRPRT